MISQSIAKIIIREVKIMDFQEILNIIQAFFDAIAKIFESLGIFKAKEEENETEAKVEA